MTMIVEDGTGVVGANSYATEAEVLAYLTDRDRQEENSWNTSTSPQREAAIVTATDFIEQRWGGRFMGHREFQDVSVARATLTFTTIPTAAKTVTVDGVAYTFGAALGGANSVLIGASVTASLLNLVNAITAVPAEEGVSYGTGTVVHPTVSATEGVGDTMIVTARARGTAGNGIVVATTVVGASWSSATLAGGGDVLVPQPLSFPRVWLLDREGLQVRGIPARVKAATAEYAVRARASALMPDPTIDATGRVVASVRQKVGPIETETRYEEGSALSHLLRPYPAADRLLSAYVTRVGRVTRG